MFITTRTQVGDVRGPLAHTFVYERDQHQVVYASMLQEMRWPSVEDLSAMRDRQMAEDEQQRREDEADEAYYRELDEEYRRQAIEDALDAMEDTLDADDVDCDVCQCCGRFYGPHEKEKSWVPTRHSIMPQRCFRCWDV